MFYEPDKRNHGLKYNPFKALVVPRPIGWISTVDPMECPIWRPTACSTLSQVTPRA